MFIVFICIYIWLSYVLCVCMCGLTMYVVELMKPWAAISTISTIVTIIITTIIAPSITTTSITTTNHNSLIRNTITNIVT